MLKSSIEDLQSLFEFEQRPNLRPRYNIAPSQDVVIVRNVSDRRLGSTGSKRVLTKARWGLVPSWADGLSVGYKMINARAETADRLPSYRDAYRKRRCLIPADGFFEWKVPPHQGKQAIKQPFLIRKSDHAPFAFAGLYEHWRHADGGVAIESCTIITTAANQKLREIHHRMPVILDKVDFETWLDPNMDGRPLLKPCPDSLLESIMISDRINKPAHDEPTVIEPIERPIEPAQGNLFGL